MPHSNNSWHKTINTLPFARELLSRNSTIRPRTRNLRRAVENRCSRHSNLNRRFKEQAFQLFHKAGVAFPLKPSKSKSSRYTKLTNSQFRYRLFRHTYNQRLQTILGIVENLREAKRGEKTRERQARSSK